MLLSWQEFFTFVDARLNLSAYEYISIDKIGRSPTGIYSTVQLVKHMMLK